jgi:hypothetical protein
LLEAFYTGVTNAHGPLADQLGGFTSTFAPVKVEPDFFKIALDIFGLGFALTAAPIWNSGESFRGSRELNILTDNS